MSQTLANSRRGRSTRVVTGVALALFVSLLVLWGVVSFWGDEAAIPSLFLFGPRWVVVVPFALLVPLVIWTRSRRAIALTLLSGIIVAGPLTGGTAAVGPQFVAERPALVQLRVVSWNMGGRVDRPAFVQFLAQTGATLIVCQECGIGPDELPKGWTLLGAGGNRVATPLPIRLDASLDFNPLGVGGRLDRFVLDTPDGEITLIDVHLPTVRPGIETAMGSKFRDLSELRRIIGIREQASRSARAWVGEPAPSMIAVGDFNMPVESRIYRRDWSAFRNAFDDAGTGWGTTKQTSWFGVRIDHILFAPSWRCRRIWVGPPMGSDHRPVIADLVREDD